MDFWDLTKVLVRRWYLAVPGLLLTAIASVYMYATVQPYYISTAYVQMVPPTPRATTAGEPSLEARNPWISMGVGTLANTSVLTMYQPSVLDALYAGGYSTTYEVWVDDYTPLVTFEVTGSSREQATATTEELIRRFTTTITDLQVGVYQVSEGDLATAKRIDLGNNITESNANVKRIMVAVAGAGIVLTFALAIAVDVLATRRARRRAGGTPGVSIEDLSPPPTGPAPATARPAPAPTPATPARALEAPALVGAPQAFIERASAGAEPLGIERAPAGDLRIDDTRVVGEPAAADQPDETVVLPLAYRAPRRRSSNGGTGQR